jgi:mono/diheme cytochrome c family protein
MRFIGAVALAVSLLLARDAAAQDRDLIARGEYLTRVGGCFSCHTAPGAEPLAGGRALATPFGTFYSPNITPDRDTGIGGWTEADFRRALRQGLRPDGTNYFPVFPYPSFTNIGDDDARAIWAYLLSRPPVRRANQAHDVAFPFSWRLLQTGWKLLFFRPGPFQADPKGNASRNRGAYLVTALSHCGECHTPRNRLGGVQRDLFLAGTQDGPEGALVPNITPDRKTGIGDWTKDDVTELLKTGTTPEQSKVKGPMREAVQDGLKYLTDADRDAIADYLLALPPIEHVVRKQP